MRNTTRAKSRNRGKEQMAVADLYPDLLAAMVEAEIWVGPLIILQPPAAVLELLDQVGATPR